MDNKNCNGYESRFLFLNDEDFKKHLSECESCRLEHEKMQKISSLIQEAKPYLKKKQKVRKNLMKAACAAFVVFVMSGCYSMFMMTGLYDDVVAYNSMNSPTIEEMGLPVDEYGFLMVD